MSLAHTVVNIKLADAQRQSVDAAQLTSLCMLAMTSTTIRWPCTVGRLLQGEGDVSVWCLDV